MHDIAGVITINATVLSASFFRHRAIQRLRAEVLGEIRNLRSDLLDGLDSLRSAVTSKLDAAHYREQQQ